MDGNVVFPSRSLNGGSSGTLGGDKPQLRGWLVLCAADGRPTPVVRREGSRPPSLCPAPGRSGGPTAPRLLSGAALGLRQGRLGLSISFLWTGRGLRKADRGRKEKGAERR